MRIKHIDADTVSPSVPSVASSPSNEPSPVDELSVLSTYSTPPPSNIPVTAVPTPCSSEKQAPPATATATAMPCITTPLIDSAQLVMDMTMTPSRQRLTTREPFKPQLKYTFKPYPTLRQQQQMFSRHPNDKSPGESLFIQKEPTGPVLPTEQLPATAAMMSRPSFRLHQKPAQPLSRITSFKRKMSTRSTRASHGCNDYDNHVKRIWFSNETAVFYF